MYTTNKTNLSLTDKLKGIKKCINEGTETKNQPITTQETSSKKRRIDFSGCSLPDSEITKRLRTTYCPTTIPQNLPESSQPIPVLPLPNQTVIPQTAVFIPSNRTTLRISKIPGASIEQKIDMQALEFHKNLKKNQIVFTDLSDLHSDNQ